MCHDDDDDMTCMIWDYSTCSFVSYVLCHVATNKIMMIKDDIQYVESY